MADTVIGNGKDAIVLRVSEDAVEGHAQFTVTLDGQRIDGVVTTTASHAQGQFDTVTVKADLMAGPHTLTVDFLNDAFGGTPDTDRNLYVDGAFLYGPIPDSARTLFAAGPTDISFQAAATDPNPPPGPVPVRNQIGAGPDALVLRVSQDFDMSQGGVPAQYTVSVDGVQIGGVVSAGARHDVGQPDTLVVNGAWAPGEHTVEVNFLNDSYGGTPDTDRNLYVDGATFEGADVSGGSLSLFEAGVGSFTFVDSGSQLFA